MPNSIFMCFGSCTDLNAIMQYNVIKGALLEINLTHFQIQMHEQVLLAPAYTHEWQALHMPCWGMRLAIQSEREFDDSHEVDSWDRP